MHVVFVVVVMPILIVHSGHHVRHVVVVSILPAHRAWASHIESLHAIVEGTGVATMTMRNEAVVGHPFPPNSALHKPRSFEIWGGKKSTSENQNKDLSTQ
jgi:hypothetical protein